MKFVDEFKDFISRGNVVDMAVGVVVGGAFKSIVDSLVADIINPGIAAKSKEGGVFEPYYPPNYAPQEVRITPVSPTK